LLVHPIEKCYLETTDRPGGRIKTDLQDIFWTEISSALTAYPETQTLLNYTDLNFKKMLPGPLCSMMVVLLKLQILQDHRRHLQRFCSCRYFKDKD
jgi:hypothetical protein